MDEAKLKRIFGGRVVDKGKTRITSLEEFPRYVLEYLIGNYCEEETFEEDLLQVTKRIRENFAQASEAEVIKHRIKQQGRYSIIASLEVRLEETENRYWGAITSLNERYLNVDERLVRDYEPLLHGGMWGTVTIGYDEKVVHNKKIRPFVVLEFTPFQVARVRLDDYIGHRSEFTTDEWMELLINSLGLNPGPYTRREKLLLLSRLVPLVETNSNCIEMAPRETGKTYLYRNISYYSHVLSGGKVTRAGLFINLASGRIGLVGTRDAVVFDEVAKVEFSNPQEMVGVLQGYMQDGKFGIGVRQEVAFASMVLVGNLDVQAQLPHEKYGDLFEMLPAFLREEALLDRIHAYLPGWEIPKITPGSYAEGYGFVSDYFSEVLHLLRGKEVIGALSKRFELRDLAGTPAGITGRDERAIHKTLSGLVKVLYPDGEVTDEELEELLLLAVELRQRVRNQLHLMAPGEYQPVRIGVQVGGGDATAPPLPDAARSQRVVVPDEDRIGEVNGLAVAGTRGEVLRFEVIVNKGTGRLIELGSIQRVMKESVEAAYEYIRNQQGTLGIPSDFRRDYDIVLLATQMGIPKEGPSAGVTVLTGLVSALTRRPVRRRVAMTGEITIMGRVLAVGGIAEKVRAAAECGCTDVFVPAENQPDIDNLPSDLQGKVAVHLVAAVDELLEAVLLPARGSLGEA